MTGIFELKVFFWERFPPDKSALVLIPDPVDQGLGLCPLSAKSAS